MITAMTTRMAAIMNAPFFAGCLHNAEYAAAEGEEACFHKAHGLLLGESGAVEVKCPTQLAKGHAIRRMQRHSAEYLGEAFDLMAADGKVQNIPAEC